MNKMNKSDQMTIPIDQIDFDDQTYVFTYESNLSPIISSIEKVGLINPTILEQRLDKNYRIVSGIKRILALQHLKIDQLLA